MNDIKEIDRIIFGILSAKNIIDMSVCKIDSSKLIGPNTVYDERMGGSLDTNKDCVTCGLNSRRCGGHFSYIELNENVIHPLYYKMVVSFLRCFCIQCHKLLINEEQINLCGLNRYKQERRFKKILEKLEKVDICCNCNHPQPKISHSTDNTISMVYKEKLVDCDDKKGKKRENKISIALTVDEIKKVFEYIPDEDVVLCGFDPDRMHPKDLILSVLPVLPPCTRPPSVSDGNICDDDLTNQYCEIIKANNILKKDDIQLDAKKQKEKDARKQKAYQTLKFRIATLFNNSSGKAKHPTNGRPIKGIKERLTGKTGQIRLNLMGKRCEFSGRTVIGPDPNLKFGWMGMPKEIATELTIPEKVTSFNIDYLTRLVNDGKANFVVKANSDTKINLKYAREKKGTLLLYNDEVIRGDTKIKVTNANVTLKSGDRIKRDGVVMISPEDMYRELRARDIIVRGSKKLFVDEYLTLQIGDIIERDNHVINTVDVVYPTIKQIFLNEGDEVHRHLMDGDTVLLNRQPTLHKGSMIAKKIRILQGKTFRMNLDTCKSFNADFDGDEMNIHVSQSLEARAELEGISATKYHIISAQGSKPNITIVQDSLCASFLMTKNPDNTLTQGQFFDICMKCEKGGMPVWSPEKINTIKKVFKMKGKAQNIYSGRSLFSLILPDDFIYEKKNDAMPAEKTIKIYNGVMYEGALEKSVLGSSHNAIHQVILKEYGVDVASEFISNIQFITNGWMLVNGFSVGLEDCMATSVESTSQIKDKISKYYIEAGMIEETTLNLGIREIRVTASLNKAKDVGMRIAKESMDPNNNLLSTVKSGSKGDYFNIAQLTGLLGQQNLLGQRVTPTLNNGKRTLPHYPFKITSKEVEYESRGFIRHSFIEGLSPQEFYFHAMSGREGVCDTAMGTAKSGYIQRRIIKICEDMKVGYDGSIRDTIGNIYQMAYGDNGLDPTQTIKVGDEQQECDISRIVSRLNLNQEINTDNLIKSQLLNELYNKTKRDYNDWSIEELMQRLDGLKEFEK